MQTWQFLYTFCLISISNLKTGRFETRRFETLTFCKPDVLKQDVLKPDVSKPDVLKPDVLWVYRIESVNKCAGSNFNLHFSLLR